MAKKSFVDWLYKMCIRDRPLIIGEIQRFLRDDGMVHISRKIQDDARKIAIIREKYRMNENSEIFVSYTHLDVYKRQV